MLFLNNAHGTGGGSREGCTGGQGCAGGQGRVYWWSGVCSRSGEGVLVLREGVQVVRGGCVCN